MKRGSLTDAVAYIHAKLDLGGTCSDLVIWFYYPFNGPSVFQFGEFTISVIGTWEHISLRINNYDGILTSIYLAQHAKGKWLAANEFVYINGRPVTRVCSFA